RGQLHRVRRRTQETPGRGRCPAASRTLQEAGLRKVTFFGNFSGALPATEWRRNAALPNQKKFLQNNRLARQTHPGARMALSFLLQSIAQEGCRYFFRCYFRVLSPLINLRHYVLILQKRAFHA